MLKEIHFNWQKSNISLNIIDEKIENDSDVRHAYQVLKLTRGII